LLYPPRGRKTRDLKEIHVNALDAEAEDHRKYIYALLARDIRRLTATIHRTDIDDGKREMIDTALEQLETRAWLMSFHDPVSGDLIEDEDVYADGRWVTTRISWGEGYATLVHCPDPNDESGGAAEELAEELWPEGPSPADHRGA
jgi:hypothetical protein